MKIELKDRDYWITLCDDRIKRVIEARKKKDDEFEKEWRKRLWPFKNRPDTEFPPQGIGYPSIYGWGTLQTAVTLKKVLEHKHTGIIDITDEEYNLLF